jgi:hypothetical protein
MLSVAPYAMRTGAERENCGLLPDSQRRSNHDRLSNPCVASPDTTDGPGTDWVAAAFDVTDVSCFRETRERSPLLLAPAREAGHATTLAESRKASAFLNGEADIHELRRMNVDAPWARGFEFRTFAVDVFGTYGAGATTIIQHLARKRGEHTSMAVSTFTRLSFQPLSVAPQTANARTDVAVAESFTPLLSQLPQSWDLA